MPIPFETNEGAFGEKVAYHRVEGGFRAVVRCARGHFFLGTSSIAVRHELRQLR